MDIKQPITRLEFRSIGFTKGKYISSDPENPFFNKGHIITPDGLSIAAYVLNKNLLRLFAKNPALLTEEQIWTVYMRQFFLENRPAGFKYQIKHLRTDINDFEVDRFSIRGIITKQDRRNGILQIEVRRNIEVPEDQKEERRFKSFRMQVEGKIATRADGQFWELDVTRDVERLILTKAKFVAMMDRQAGRSFSQNHEHNGAARYQNNSRLAEDTDQAQSAPIRKVIDLRSHPPG